MASHQDNLINHLYYNTVIMDFDFFGEDLSESRKDMLISPSNIAVIDLYNEFVIFNKLPQGAFLSIDNTILLFKFIIEFSIIDCFPACVEIEELAYACNIFSSFSFIDYPDQDVEDETIYDFIYCVVTTIMNIRDSVQITLKNNNIDVNGSMPYKWDIIPSVSPIDEIYVKGIKLVLVIPEILPDTTDILVSRKRNIMKYKQKKVIDA